MAFCMIYIEQVLGPSLTLVVVMGALYCDLGIREIFSQ